MMELILAGLLTLGGSLGDGDGVPGHVTLVTDGADSVPQAPYRRDSDPQATYWIYVGAESADLLHRIRFGPDGVHREADVSMAELYRQSDRGELFTESEAPHGVAVDPRRGVVYMTTGHGVPDGKLWKVEAGGGRLMADPVDLGRFPASLGVSPDGNYVYVANFNLHGRMVPSSISVIYGPEMMEVARIETCTMPHGSRVSPDGTRHYSVCMMDDQLVEMETRGFTVHRRFHLDPHDPHPLPADYEAADHGHHEMSQAPVCSPTWATPSPDGSRIYVACNAADQILEIDAEDWSLRRTMETGPGPYNLEVTPDNRALVVTLKQGDGVEFIDLETGTMLGQAATSTRVPHGVAITPDSRLAFISVEGVGTEPGRVDVFDLTTLERIHSLEVGLQAAGIAVLDVEPVP